MIVFATNHDEDTKVSFAFAKKILGSDDIFLANEKAVYQYLTTTLAQNPTIPLCGFSHGEEGFWKGNNKQKALTIADITLLANRKTYAYACLTAKELGFAVAKMPNSYYWGYNQPVLMGRSVSTDIIRHVVNVLLFIKNNFHEKESLKAIETFLIALKILCDNEYETYSAATAKKQSDWFKIAGLAQIVNDIWSKLEVHFDNQKIAHPNAPLPSLEWL
jgi:hypothetical protein